MTLERIAELLRDADLALRESTAALIAFVRPGPIPDSVDRACERNDEVRKAIAVVLVDLPPEPPLTPEQEAECKALISDALRKRGW